MFRLARRTHLSGAGFRASGVTNDNEGLRKRWSKGTWYGNGGQIPMLAFTKASNILAIKKQLDQKQCMVGFKICIEFRALVQSNMKYHRQFILIFVK